MSKVSTEVKEPIPAVDFPVQGFGTCHSSGTIVALLMALEEPEQRAQILVDVMKQFGVTLEEIEGIYNDHACSECGMSMAMHKGNGGKCF